MTHHYVTTSAGAASWRVPRYLGLLAEERAEKILADLARDGLTVTAEQRARLHAGGLDLGATRQQVASPSSQNMQAALAGAMRGRCANGSPDPWLKSRRPVPLRRRHLRRG